MKNTKEEKSKQHHKKPEPLNVEARWGKLFSVPMLHITVPELYIKDLLEITDKIIEIESGVSRFSNKKYIIEYMGPYNGDNFISAYDISTKFVLKNDNLLFITNISYTDEGFLNVIADCSKIVELL